MSAFYIMRITEEGGITSGAAYIGNGVMAGVDTGEVMFDGHYTIHGERMVGEIAMTRPHGEAVTLTFDWPTTFADGSEQALTVEGNSVRVRFEKLKELP